MSVGGSQNFTHDDTMRTNIRIVGGGNHVSQEGIQIPDLSNHRTRNPHC